MKVNLVVEDMGPFKYLGCATAAKNLYNALRGEIEVGWNDKSVDYDIVHFHTFGPISLWYKKRSRGKKIITAHSTPRLNYGNLAAPSLVNWLYTPIYKSFEHIVAVSEKCKKELEKELGLKKVSVIYNGIDIKRFSPDKEKGKRFREIFKIADDELLVLTIAQITPRKGVYDFLDVARRFPGFRFVWVGGFPYGLFSKDYFKIKKLISMKSKNCIFTGFVPDIVGAYSAADVFFMPSYAEGHSIVMLEALAMGLPILARDLEEFREEFGNNLIYFKDKEDVKEEMFDRKLLEEYKKKTKVVKKFDIERVANEHVNFYEKLLKS